MSKKPRQGFRSWRSGALLLYVAFFHTFVGTVCFPSPYLLHSYRKRSTWPRWPSQLLETLVLPSVTVSIFVVNVCLILIGRWWESFYPQETLRGGAAVIFFLSLEDKPISIFLGWEKTGNFTHQNIYISSYCSSNNTNTVPYWHMCIFKNIEKFANTNICIMDFFFFLTYERS